MSSVPAGVEPAVRFKDYKARADLLYRALDLLSVADDSSFFESYGDEESNWAPWTVRLVIEECGPDSYERGF